MQLELESHTSLEHVREFLAGGPGEGVPVPGRKEADGHVEQVLLRFSYWKLGKAPLRRYLREGRLERGRRRPARPFGKVYGRTSWRWQRWTRRTGRCRGRRRGCC